MLSIVVVSRNDDHGDNLLDRMSACFAAFDAYYHKYDWDVEIVVVDWNPPQRRLLLHEVFGDVYDIPMRFVVVPPEVHNQYLHSEIIPLYQMIGKNVGIRHARGNWVLVTNIDVIFNDRLAWHLACREDTLMENAFYRAIRFDTSLRRLPLISINEQVLLCRMNIIRVMNSPPNRLHTNACGDFTMMTKSNWEKMRGYMEWPIWSIHIDSLGLIRAKGLGLDQRVFDRSHRVYHLEHGNLWVSDKSFATQLPKLSNIYEHGNLLEKVLTGKMKNREDWGLSLLKQERVEDNVVRLSGTLTGLEQQQEVVNALPLA